MSREPNTAFIGPKPAISYVLAVTMLFSADKNKGAFGADCQLLISID